MHKLCRSTYSITSIGQLDIFAPGTSEWKLGFCILHEFIALFIVGGGLAVGTVLLVGM